MNDQQIILGFVLILISFLGGVFLTEFGYPEGMKKLSSLFFIMCGMVIGIRFAVKTM